MRLMFKLRFTRLAQVNASRRISYAGSSIRFSVARHAH